MIFFLQSLYQVRSQFCTFHSFNLTMEKLIMVSCILTGDKMLSRKFLSIDFASFYHYQKLKV